jgi:heme iron utilization protein
MTNNLNEFLETIKSLTISSLDDKGQPFSSYAPYVKFKHKYYVYLSLMAKHSSNLTQNNIASIFFCEDEQDCKNIFAKKRVSIQCETVKLEQNTENESEILDEFRNKFGEDMVNMLKKMGDF